MSMPTRFDVVPVDTLNTILTFAQDTLAGHWQEHVDMQEKLHQQMQQRFKKKEKELREEMQATHKIELANLKRQLHESNQDLEAERQEIKRLRLTHSAATEKMQNFCTQFLQQFSQN